MSETDESTTNNRGPDRPVRQHHGRGILCSVCIARGKPRSIYAFEVDEERIEEIRDKNWSTKKKEKRIKEEEQKPREQFRKHWNSRHW